jgi:hypothetical protein
MKKKIFITLLFTLIFIFSVGIAFAAHYVEGYSAVDEGEIRWGGTTKYLTQWKAGISTWQALRKIYIAPDTVWTFEDLTVSDVYNSDTQFAGWYQPKVGSDSLKFNTYYMNKATNAQKQLASTHELGHALGLDHSIPGNVMYFMGDSQTWLGTQDKYDYRYLWGN